MSGVHIVTDSSCDLVPDEIKALDIEVVPLSIRFGDEEFTDRRDLSVEDFYRKMASADDLPQTACPSPGAFGQAFRDTGAAGADAVVCITISSDLSNTFQSAQTAADALQGDVPVVVLDSKSVSSGAGTLVLEAAKRPPRAPSSTRCGAGSTTSSPGPTCSPPSTRWRTSRRGAASAGPRRWWVRSFRSSP